MARKRVVPTTELQERGGRRALPKGKKWWHDTKTDDWWQAAPDGTLERNFGPRPLTRAEKRKEEAAKLYGGKIVVHAGPGRPPEVDQRVNVNVGIPMAQKKWLKEEADRNNRNFSEMLRYILDLVYKHGEDLTKGAEQEEPESPKPTMYSVLPSQDAWLNQEANRLNTSKSELLRLLIENAREVISQFTSSAHSS